MRSKFSSVFKPSNRKCLPYVSKSAGSRARLLNTQRLPINLFQFDTSDLTPHPHQPSPPPSTPSPFPSRLCDLSSGTLSSDFYIKVNMLYDFQSYMRIRLRTRKLLPKQLTERNKFYLNVNR